MWQRETKPNGINTKNMAPLNPYVAKGLNFGLVFIQYFVHASSEDM